MSRQEKLERLRAQFPDWDFRWHEVEPSWHAKRKVADYVDRSAVCTEVRGTDPSEVAVFLLYVVAIEPVEQPWRRGDHDTSAMASA
ncbi:hypothetical protein BZB76_5209 [Actinomadura pelletieri DSM 43383]|uniref:Uncharacterized protein n=1 Tax=Actinomadura pelletieri DSM 43383 TaxID=1120940 RepID=A0A495QFP3_9ACTN|nr:hypothetical protein [Actinomadura pelletieri]RKS70730.1 hypothetical protein BZB76_5209 [Actinomadura pelletieri DSM 43383]